MPGLLTDIHYADKKPAGTRHYRDSLVKLEHAITKLNTDRPDLVFELGDFVDAASTVKTEIGYLKHIEKVYAAAKAPRHYVLGNHCVATLTKDEFFEHTAAKRGYDSFDHNGFHFVILDACFRADGVAYGRSNNRWDDTEIPPDQRAWLKGDLAKTERKTIVFVHQRLDLKPPSPYLIKSAPAVRRILEDSGKVLAVFQGHSHHNDHHEIGGVHYVTIPAIIEGPAKPTDSKVEPNAFAMLEVFADGSLRVRGFGRTKSQAIPLRAARL